MILIDKEKEIFLSQQIISILTIDRGMRRGVKLRRQLPRFTWQLTAVWKQVPESAPCHRRHRRVLASKHFNSV